MIVFDARKLGGYDVFLHYLGSSLYNRHSFPNALLSGALATVFAYNESCESWLSQHILHPSAYFGGISFIVGFVVVYRSQISYQRYSEAQKAYFDMSSKMHDFISFMNAFLLGNDEETKQLRNTLIRWGRAYHELAIEEFQGIEFGVQHRANLTEEETQLLARDRKRMIQVSSWMQRIVMENRDKFAAGDAILSRAYQIKSEANLFCNNVRRIAETPFPFPFVQLTAMMINLWSIMTPVLVGTFFPSSYVFAFMVAASGTWILFAVNETAAQLEDPFDVSSNNLPVVFYSIAFDDDMSAIKYMEYPEVFRALKANRKDPSDKTDIDESNTKNQPQPVTKTASEPQDDVQEQDDDEEQHVTFAAIGSDIEEEPPGLYDSEDGGSESDVRSSQTKAEKARPGRARSSSAILHSNSKPFQDDDVRVEIKNIAQPPPISTKDDDDAAPAMHIRSSSEQWGSVSPNLSKSLFRLGRSKAELLKSFRLRTAMPSSSHDEEESPSSFDRHDSLRDVDVSFRGKLPFHSASADTEDTLGEDDPPLRSISAEVLYDPDQISKNDDERNQASATALVQREVPIPAVTRKKKDRPKSKLFDLFDLDQEALADQVNTFPPTPPVTPHGGAVHEAVPKARSILKKAESSGVQSGTGEVSAEERRKIDRMDASAVLYHTVHGADAAKMAEELHAEREMQRRITANRAAFLRHKLREHKHEMRRHIFHVTSMNSELPARPEELEDHNMQLVTQTFRGRLSDFLKYVGKDESATAKRDSSLSTLTSQGDLKASGVETTQTDESVKHQDHTDAASTAERQSSERSKRKKKSFSLPRFSSHSTKHHTGLLSYPGWTAESLTQIRSKGIFGVYN